MRILLVDEISKEVQTKMENGLKEHEMSHDINVNYKPFALELFNEKDEVIGVLDAFSSYSCIHIRDLWVDKAYRGKGYGRKLIEALETQFKHSGFHNINTVSCDFQAPEFYKKCGFQVEFVRSNKQNSKLTMTFFIKFFE